LVDSKTCSKCGITKSVDSFHFRNKKKNDRQPICSVCKSAYSKQQYKHRCDIDPTYHKLRMRQTYLKSTYGLTLEDYMIIHNNQSGVCAICGGVDSHQLLSVDHDHNTGLVRGLLCNSCNSMLGYARDNPDLLLLGAQYLERNH